MLRIEIAIAALILVAVAAYFLGKRHARRLQHERRIRIDRFKLKQRHADIELEVFGSREVVQAVQAYAKENHVSTEAALKQAKTYLREIVPKFNLLAYYRFGAPVAKGIMYFLYRPVVERTLLRVFNDRAPKGSVVVYVINHRSNADYVLVAHMLFEFISLDRKSTRLNSSHRTISYAVFCLKKKNRNQFQLPIYFLYFFFLYISLELFSTLFHTSDC